MLQAVCNVGDRVRMTVVGAQRSNMPLGTEGRISRTYSQSILNYPETNRVAIVWDGRKIEDAGYYTPERTECYILIEPPAIEDVWLDELVLNEP